MASKTPLFESGRAHLKAGENDSITRGDESTVGELHEMVLGGGIAVRLLNGKAKSVPQKVAASDLEVLEFMAVISLAGEHEDGAWWMRKDQLVLRATDEGYNASKALKKSWGRVDKGRLPEPIFAPRLPGTAGANGDWHALLELVVEKHNAGEVPDLISFGARAPWLDAPNVFPTLRTIRDRNLAALKGACTALHRTILSACRVGARVFGGLGPSTATTAAILFYHYHMIIPLALTHWRSCC